MPLTLTNSAGNAVLLLDSRPHTPSVSSRDASSMHSRPLIWIVLPAVLIFFVAIALGYLVYHLRTRKKWHTISERTSKLRELSLVKWGLRKVRYERGWESISGLDRNTGEEGDSFKSDGPSADVELGYVGASSPQGRQSSEQFLPWSLYKWEGPDSASTSRVLDMASSVGAHDDLIRLDTDGSISPSNGQTLVARRPRPAESLVSISPPPSPPSVIPVLPRPQGAVSSSGLSRVASPEAHEAPRVVVPAESTEDKGRALSANSSNPVDPFATPPLPVALELDPSNDPGDPFASPPLSPRVEFCPSPKGEFGPDNKVDDEHCLYPFFSPFTELVSREGHLDVAPLDPTVLFNDIGITSIRTQPAPLVFGMQQMTVSATFPFAEIGRDISSPASSTSHSPSTSSATAQDNEGSVSVDLGADRNHFPPFVTQDSIASLPMPLPLEDTFATCSFYNVEAARSERDDVGGLATKTAAEEGPEEHDKRRDDRIQGPVIAAGAAQDLPCQSSHLEDASDSKQLPNDCPDVMVPGDASVQHDQILLSPWQAEADSSAPSVVAVDLADVKPCSLPEHSVSLWSDPEPDSIDILAEFSSGSPKMRQGLDVAKPNDASSMPSIVSSPASIDSLPPGLLSHPELINFDASSPTSLQNSVQATNVLDDLVGLEDAFRDAFSNPDHVRPSKPDSPFVPFSDPPSPVIATKDSFLCNVPEPDLPPSSLVPPKNSLERIAPSLPPTPPLTPPHVPASLPSLKADGAGIRVRSGSKSDVLPPASSISRSVPSSPSKPKSKTLPPPKSPKAKKVIARSYTLPLSLAPPAVIAKDVPVDLALALQLDPAWMVRVLFTFVGWMAIFVASRRPVKVKGAVRGKGEPVVVKNVPS